MLKNGKLTVSKALEILKGKNSIGYVYAAGQLVNSLEGRKFITPELINELNPNSAYILTHALRDRPKGRELLAEHYEITDALFKKDPANIAIILAHALRITPKGMERLKNDQPFIDEMLQSDKRDEVRIALRKFLTGKNLVRPNDEISKEVRKQLEEIEHKSNLERERISATTKAARAAKRYRDNRGR